MSSMIQNNPLESELSTSPNVPNENISAISLKKITKI